LGSTLLNTQDSIEISTVFSVSLP